MHDIVVLIEIMISKLPHVPGFIPIIAKTVNPRRGGLAILVKSRLYPEICHIDLSANDQLWFSFRSIPHIRFGGVYIVPSSSPYFNERDIALLQAKSVDPNLKYVIIGDLNARVGTKADELVEHTRYSYQMPVDTIQNENGKKLLSVCKDNKLIIINNLQTHGNRFPGSLTFRRRKKWISQLDVCITSEELIPYITRFTINQDTSFPSNHAPISVDFTFPEARISIQEILKRSTEIGCYPEPKTSPQICKRPISIHRIDPEQFRENICAVDPALALSGDHNELAERFGEILYETISNSTYPPSRNTESYDASTSRWERIMSCENDSILWKAIDWKGQFNPVPPEEGSQPSESQFQAHLEKLLNPEGSQSIETDLSNYHVEIPILDSRIQLKEVEEVLEKQVKGDKGCGPDGNSPGAYKLLPLQWIEFLCYLFNIIFVAGYPLAWSAAKLIMLFKKGLRTLCDNYRGISVINAISKIYDYVINNRLILWYTVCREQAGAQAKRGCIEHIVTLRLLFNVFLRKRVKLFVVFVDFSKAYDMVPRSRLFDILVDLGCGVTMLSALVSMYSNTTNILGSTVITSTIGVRQGSPTSCYLFIIFVDVLILLLKSKCSTEPILGWLHCLMLMDDTVILATSREKMLEKLQLLDQYCLENGMKVNTSKTKLMVINGKPLDKVPLVLSNFIVRACSEYVYLGTIFTADGRTDSSLEAHLESMNKEVNKLLIFFATNYDAPFYVKKRVLEAAFMSCILYGCEAWLNVPLKKVETMYMKAVKAMLGVRITTPNELCLIEAGLRPLNAIVKTRQKKFLTKMLEERSDMVDDPFTHVFGITRDMNSTMWSYIESILSGDDFILDEITRIKQNIVAKPMSATKFQTYRELNPNLETHFLYTRSAPTIPDYLRITFTRYRISSHRLRIEMGRWSRTPPDQRVCSCGTGVQNELHIFQCPLVHDLLNGPNKCYISPWDFFNDTKVEDLLTLHQALDKLYEKAENISDSE